MIKVVELLRLPSLKEGYIAAGGNGIYNVIRRFEILEETYPSVVRFLSEGIFYVTNFWSLANDKESRIRLIEEMIEHRCAGIGIMPGAHLDNEIDQEILELANENKFPVLYIPQTVRWGNLLAEYSVVSNNSFDLRERSWLDMALDSFVDFHISRDPGVLCQKISEILHLPVVISAVTVYSHGTEGINVAILISRIQNIRKSGRAILLSPLLVRVDNSRVALVYLGAGSMIACCIDRARAQENILQLYHQIAPFVIRELDQISRINPNKQDHYHFQYSEDRRMYLALVKVENCERVKSIFGKKYIIYESNVYQKYSIVLIPEEKCEKNTSIYDIYYEIMNEIKPDLFVFSQEKYAYQTMSQEIDRIKNLINSLLFLNGCFSTQELSLIYLLANTPQEYEFLLYTAEQNKIKDSSDITPFLNTLRLYFVLRSITDVSHLMGIHVNSVKYRIDKALQYLGMEEEMPVSEVPYLQLLLLLEHFVAENK